MSKKLAYKVRGQVSFNRRDCVVSKKGGRVLVSFNTPQRLNLVLLGILRAGNDSIGRKALTENLNSRHDLEYSREDVGYAISRLVRMGLVQVYGEGCNSTYCATQAAVDRLRAASVQVV